MLYEVITDEDRLRLVVRNDGRGFDPDNLLHTAELGVVLLLFVIGLELQPSRLSYNFV